MATKKPKKVRGVYEDPKGSGIWWAQHFTPNRTRERVGRKSDAIALYQKRRSDYRAGIKLPDLRRRKVTLGDLADDALDFAREHNKSVRDYVTKSKRLKNSILGDRIAEELRPDELSDWIKSLKKKQSPATFNRYRAFISLCYREGMRVGKVKTNPARLVRQKKEPQGRFRYLSRDEFDKLNMLISDQDNSDAFMISVLTGPRLTEEFTVEWMQFDPDRSVINLTETKNGEDGTLVLNSLARQILIDRKRRLKPKPREKIFPGNTKGGRVDTRTWFTPALAEAGIEGYTWHCNRHTFCSWLALAGVPLKTIQVLARHKTIAVTAKYAHLSPDHTQTEAERILSAPPANNVIQIDRKTA